MSPLYDSEGGLYSLFDALMRYDEETGSTGEISVYKFLRITNSRAPYGCPEYKYNLILNTCTVKRVDSDGNRWWARFNLIKRRESWDTVERKSKSCFYET